jgi:hypothetical protein
LKPENAIIIFVAQFSVEVLGDSAIKRSETSV